MKRVILIFGTLVVIFIGVWTVKLKTPVQPSDPYVTGLSDKTPWWETSNGEAPTPDADYILDHEIPENYIPCIGQRELYMVVDENGSIVKYRQREQQDDGSWVWDDVDPNIPQNYEPVDGLENVYKVVDIDGTTRYYLYTRNSDDTYFFTEVDSAGQPLVDDTPQNDEIPPNFIRVDGTNVYAIYNEYGVLIGYKERIENDDGTYSWVDAEAPVQNDYTPGFSIGGGSGNIEVPDIEGGNGGGTTIVSGSGEEHWGYDQKETYTDIEHKDGFVIVYETTITSHYNEYGELESTQKEGPVEVNRIPESLYTEGMDVLQGAGVTQQK